MIGDVAAAAGVADFDPNARELRPGEEDVLFASCLSQCDDGVVLRP
jgi:hypothetical protein